MLFTKCKYLDINPSFQILNFSDIGDSIIKIKDENICFVIKKNGTSKKFSYVEASVMIKNFLNSEKISGWNLQFYWIRWY